MPKPWASVPALAFIALFLLFTSGCAQLREQPGSTRHTPASWSTHLAKMRAINNWQLKGKLAYHHSKKTGSAWFDWTQRGDDFSIYLSGPFGVGTVKINGNSQAVTLSQPGEAVISSSSSAVLTQQLFGWHLPVGQIRYWARGIPANSSTSIIETFNQKGLIKTLQEDGWQIEMSRYQVGSRGQLPGKIKGINGTLAFTLLLKDWRFQDSSQQHKPLIQQVTNPTSN